jgi:hypothetical protein
MKPYFSAIELLAPRVLIVKAEEFGQWILALPIQVAKAVREDGMFRIGGGISRSESGAFLPIENTLNFKPQKWLKK